MNETLTGRTTREIVFSMIHPATKVCMATRRMPAGTEVYARTRRDGKGLNIRIPGTLFTQHVYAAAVEPF
jgi:hypothetical protein